MHRNVSLRRRKKKEKADPRLNEGRCCNHAGDCGVYWLTLACYGLVPRCQESGNHNCAFTDNEDTRLPPSMATRIRLSVTGSQESLISLWG